MRLSMAQTGQLGKGAVLNYFAASFHLSIHSWPDLRVKPLAGLGHCIGDCLDRLARDLIEIGLIHVTNSRAEVILFLSLMELATAGDAEWSAIFTGNRFDNHLTEWIGDTAILRGGMLTNATDINSPVSTKFSHVNSSDGSALMTGSRHQMIIVGWFSAAHILSTISCGLRISEFQNLTTRQPD